MAPVVTGVRVPLVMSMAIPLPTLLSVTPEYVKTPLLTLGARFPPRISPAG